MELHDLQKTGSYKQGTLSMSYEDVVSKVFKPNTTELDDPDKVPAAWGFIDDKKREGFIWAYKHYGRIETCRSFSVSGNKDLLFDIFGDAVSFN